jgi:hypothetical protein
VEDRRRRARDLHPLARVAPRPDWPPASRDGFDGLLRDDGGPVAYDLGAPKWQWLCHVAERGDVVLHGSPNPGIDRFEPRQSNDTAEFGNRRAVYAAADGIWPMYFAIVDRSAGGVSLVNSCHRIERRTGR